MRTPTLLATLQNVARVDTPAGRRAAISRALMALGFPGAPTAGPRSTQWDLGEAGTLDMDAAGCLSIVGQGEAPPADEVIYVSPPSAKLAQDPFWLLVTPQNLVPTAEAVLECLRAFRLVSPAYAPRVEARDAAPGA